MKIRLKFFAAGAAIGLGFLVGCAEAPDAAARYKTGTLDTGDIKDLVPAIGEIQASGAVEVGSEISGKIDTVLVSFNDQVKKGQLLATLDKAPLEAALNRAEAGVASAEAQIKSAKARLGKAQLQMQRLSQLVEDGAGAGAELADLQFDIIDLESQVTQAEFALKQTTAQVVDAELALERADIRSPLDGFVLDRHIQPGQVLNAQQATPLLFTIAPNLSDITIKAMVAENDIARIDAGMEVRFQVEGNNFPIYGEVEEIRKAPHREGRFVSYPVIVRASSDYFELLPGMTASLEFIKAEASLVKRVPIRAVYYRPKDYPYDPDILERVMSRPENEGKPLDELEPSLRGAEYGKMISANQFAVFVLTDEGPSRLLVEIGIQDDDYVQVIGDDLPETARVILSEITDSEL